jgi:hypothetical protein
MILGFKLFEKVGDTYYTTSRVMNIEEFIDIEVNDRENYTIEDIKGWIEKYNINDNDSLIWVATEPYIAARYQMLAQDWDRAEEVYNENPDEYGVEIITATDGFIIPESDDGDNGYIFVIK